MIPNIPADPVEEESRSSLALLIQTFLLIGTLWASYFLSLKEIKVINETIISIIAGMIVGLIIRLLPGSTIQNMVTFNGTYFFNLLLPPIILNSGYGMRRETFFRNFGTISLFAFVGTFISSIVIGISVWIFSLLGINSLSLSLLDSMIFGSILSATDPVTVLVILQVVKAEPKLYSIIFGESILNDAVSIVLYETLNRYRGQEFRASNISHGILSFISKFGVSLSIGVLVGLLCALMLKHSHLREHSSIESCLIALIAYSSYLLSNGLHSSGIISLLFCGIMLKHYAYDNMSLKTKRATKYIFHVLAQLSENFIFIYLGLTLFTNTDLEYKLFFIFFTTIIICVGRSAAIFPLTALVNSVTRRLYGVDSIPQEYSVMLFWSGLRGAIAFALSARLEGKNTNAMLTTILVVVVISIVAFGSTTSKMLELLEIQTDVDEGEDNSDDGNETRYHHRIHSDLGPRINNIITDGPKQKHWFISFDDRYLKPFFTCREEQKYTHPHDRWYNEDEHAEDFGLVPINKKQVHDVNDNTEDSKDNHNRNSSDTNVASNSDSGNRSSENITNSNNPDN